MTYQEKKTDTGWEYKCIDIFGTVDIKSPEQLSVSLLDDLVLLLLRQDTTAQVVTGSVDYKSGKVEYTFTKESQWTDLEDDEEKDWDDTPIEIDDTEPEKISILTVIKTKLQNIWSKIKRSITALRRIWKNPQ